MAKLRMEMIGSPSDGGHKASTVAGGAKHIPNHETGSSLTISAGDADDAKMLCWMVIFGSGKDGLHIVIGKDGGIIKR